MAVGGRAYHKLVVGAVTEDVCLEVVHRMNGRLHVQTRSALGGHGSYDSLVFTNSPIWRNRWLSQSRIPRSSTLVDWSLNHGRRFEEKEANLRQCAACETRSLPHEAAAQHSHDTNAERVSQWRGQRQELRQVARE